MIIGKDILSKILTHSVYPFQVIIYSINCKKNESNLY